MKKPNLEQLKRVQEIYNYYKRYKNQQCEWSNCAEKPNLYYVLVKRKNYNILVFCNCTKHIELYTKSYLKNPDNLLTKEIISPVQRFSEKELFTIQIL